jgi:isoleucyl-tRNA synthetase
VPGSPPALAACQTVTIEPEMVRFDRKMPEDVSVVRTPHGELYIDLRVTPEIQAEGYAREVIRRIQEMRKQLDLVVSESISAEVLVNDARVHGLLSKNSVHKIAGEVLATGPDKEVLFTFIKPGDSLRTHDMVKDWEIEGATETVSMTIGISRA